MSHQATSSATTAIRSTIAIPRPSRSTNRSDLPSVSSEPPGMPTGGNRAAGLLVDCLKCVVGSALV